VPGTIEELRRRFQGGLLVLDGAMGTELERRGAGHPLPLWSAGALLSAPEVVVAIHREYVEAGADILVANTFRTNPRTLRAAGCFPDGESLNRLAVDLARRAAGGRDVLVAASVAPVENCYHPERVPTESVLRAEHEEMMIWLVAARPDLVWIETMNTLREARVAAEVAHSRGLPFAVSFVVRENGDLLSGERLEDAIAAIEPLEPLALGLNCIPPRGLTALLPRLRRATARPLAAYAHIGNPTPIRGWSFAQDVTPAEYAQYARQWLDLGATIIGGCCGTTAAHIRAVRDVVGNSQESA
jgi:S-methylmethionine-dependent homocysteine/selenocysteine methylase